MEQQAQVAIPGRFNGPPASGNGGYTCGVLAAYVEGPARVRLHAPPPLNTILTLRRDDDGQVDLLRGELLIASAWPEPLQLTIPAAPTPDEARRGSRGYPGHRFHNYPTCFVCGPGRPARDGLAIYPGPPTAGPLLGCTWQPAADLLALDGTVRAEIVWSALDCPGYFAACGPDQPNALLGELSAEIFTPVPGDRELVVYSWPIDREGRKYRGGAAIAGDDGEVLAASRSLWIALK